MKKNTLSLADVAPAVPMASVKSARSYTYRVPKTAAATIATGSQVTIPLGKQTVAGTVLRVHQTPVPYPTKSLVLRNNPPLTSGQLAFAEWIARAMHGNLGYTLRLFFSPRVAPPAGGAKWGLPPQKLSFLPSVVQPTTLPKLVIDKNDVKRYATVAEFLTPALKNKTQALILVPELRFVEPLQHFFDSKKNEVLVYHSNCTAKQLATVWQHIYEGKPALVIGTQKALFLPWRALSHTILEEEYLDTHKLWDQYPRFDNRDALPQLAAIHSSQLLYSGSFPSLARIAEDTQERLEVIRHAPVTVNPKVASLSFDDRRQGHLVPPEAVEYLKEAQRRGQRSLILHNQRGSWRAAVCTKCHQALRCPECGSTTFVSGTKGRQRLHCRQCTYAAPVPKNCPNCHHQNIRLFGPGTARMADIIQTLLPKATIVEVTAGRNRVVSDLKNADIVIGTTAVWQYTADILFDRALWLFPETTLLYPDYRSPERALHLLVQLQKSIPARTRAMIVTRYKSLVEGALASPTTKILSRLLRERERFYYPPYAELVRLTVHDRNEAKALAAGQSIREHIEAKLPSSVRVRGPYQGFNKKEGGKFAVHLLLAGPLQELIPLYENLPIDRAELSPAQIL